MRVHTAGDFIHSYAILYKIVYCGRPPVFAASCLQLPYRTALAQIFKTHHLKLTKESKK